jgi:hypothetical protein
VTVGQRGTPAHRSVPLEVERPYTGRRLPDFILRRERRWQMMYPDVDARRQFVREYRTLLAREARLLSHRQDREREPPRRRRLALKRGLRPA